MGIKGQTTGQVWLVWDGPGGHVFSVCDSERSAAIVREFYRGHPNVAAIKFDIKSWEAWK